jgi:hypothetical protein
LILLILFACGSDIDATHTDISAYIEASNRSDFPKAIADCGRITSPDRAAECIAFQVQVHGRKHPDAAREACQELQPSLWKDECHFLLAEALTVPEHPEAAAAECRKTGRYFQPCFMHLLNAHAGHLRSTQAPEDVFIAFEKALELAGPNPPTDFRHRAWSLLFRSEALDTPVIDPGVCEHLPTHGPDCRSGLREALSRALEKAMRKSNSTAREAVCAMVRPTPELAAPLFRDILGIEIEPHPVLGAPIAQWHKRHCQHRDEKPR